MAKAKKHSIRKVKGDISIRKDEEWIKETECKLQENYELDDENKTMLEEEKKSGLFEE